jgi:mono/diheme cytochrome c family protein
VLGVYGTVDIAPAHGKWPNYPKSTAETKNLNALEQDLWALSSPLWPEKLIPLDHSVAAAGKSLFEQHCASCHLPIDRTSPSRRIVAQMRDVGTDSTLTHNVTRVVKTGKLQGMPKMVNPLAVFGEQASVIDVLMNAVFGVYYAHKGDFSLVPAVARDEARGTGKLPSLGALFEALDGDAKEALAGFHGVAALAKQAFQVSGNTQTAPTNLYKARPLNGIWATGPYLHNGSVPSLAELLKQDADRVKEFYVGSWVLDPVNVGITSVAEEGGVPMFLFSTSIVGNSNTGHNFGTTLTADQKKQLIEYLKSL